MKQQVYADCMDTKLHFSHKSINAYHRRRPSFDSIVDQVIVVSFGVKDVTKAYYYLDFFYLYFLNEQFRDDIIFLSIYNSGFIKKQG